MSGPTPSEAPRLRCFISNVARCCPPANRMPTPREQSNCASFLDYELARIDPRVIVPIGLLALRAVGQRYLGSAPQAIRPLHAIPIYTADRVILPLIHPSRISRAQVEAFVSAMRGVLSDTEVTRAV
jgi:DNA polymerase